MVFMMCGFYITPLFVKMKHTLYFDESIVNIKKGYG